MDEVIQTPIQNPTAQTPKTNWLLLLSAGMIILAIGISVGLMLGNYLPKPKQIASYEDCVKANGNQMTAMFPGTCTTRDGRQFTQPLTEEEKKKLEPPDSTANWSTYADNNGKFTFQFPEKLTPKDQNSEPDASEYTQLFRVFTTFTLNSTPSFMVRVRNGLNAEQLEKEDFDYMEGHVDFKIIKREVISFSGKTAIRIKIFVGPSEDYQENRSSTYIYSDIDPQESISIRQLSMDEVQFAQILSTFKFVDQTSGVDTSNWKTYSGNGFVFKYPSGLTDLKDQGGVSGPWTGNPQSVINLGDNTTIHWGTDAPYDGFSVYTVSKLASLSLLDYLHNEVEIAKNSPRGIKSGTITEISLGGQAAAFIDNEVAHREYFVSSPDGKKIVVFSRINSTDGFLNTFGQVLSTFKFTN